jgi:hypothetical protein
MGERAITVKITLDIENIDEIIVEALTKDLQMVLEEIAYLKEQAVRHEGLTREQNSAMSELVEWAGSIDKLLTYYQVKERKDNE